MSTNAAGNVLTYLTATQMSKKYVVILKQELNSNACGTIRCDHSDHVWETKRSRHICVTLLASMAKPLTLKKNRSSAQCAMKNKREKNYTKVMAFFPARVSMSMTTYLSVLIKH